MEPLSSTLWDVVISGTGLPQSLLALALSKSGKKILHVDKNDYYGSSDAALSLDEAKIWAEQVNADNLRGFRSARLTTQYDADERSASRLGPSRAYTLSLAPQILYARSRLLPLLVSSGAHEQLDFQAIGSWWLYKEKEEAESTSRGSLERIPSGREDVFANTSLDVKAKRALMKFLRSALSEEDAEAQNWKDDSSTSLSEILDQKFRVPTVLHQPLLALSLSPSPAQSTAAKDAVPRIRKYLSSIGVFGAGFGAVTAKYGGNSELAQVGCRANAVGGGTYILGRGISSIKQSAADQISAEEDQERDGNALAVELSDGERVRGRWVVGDAANLPQDTVFKGSDRPSTTARSITIVSSGLERLFPPTSESGLVPAGAVVMCSQGGESKAIDAPKPPVYLIVHSADTGECPTGQCVIYTSTIASDTSAFKSLDEAVDKLLSVAEDAKNMKLWSLCYLQVGRPAMANSSNVLRSSKTDRILSFSLPSLDLAFEDGVIDSVREAWTCILGAESDEEFMLVGQRPRQEDADEA